jgi:hypothetical protein
MSNEISIAGAFRFGKKIPNRSRIVKVKFDDKKSKRDFIVNYKSTIAHYSYDKFPVLSFKDSYCRDDLTFLERARDKELKEELGFRRSHGENNLIIRNGKIVRKPLTSNVSYGH